MPSLLIRDQSTAGSDIDTITLDFPTEVITIREIIRERVYQEVQDYNTRTDGAFRGLVQPTGATPARRGYTLKPGRQIDWKQQFENACKAFESSRVLVLVGEKQAESLEEKVTLTRGTEVTFLRLVPLVGG
jgi:hypothetical protein